MRSLFFFVFISVLFLVSSELSCLSPDIPIIRSIEPVSSFGFYNEEESECTVHTLDLDGSLNGVNAGDWKRLTSFKAYCGGKNFDFDPPLFDFFFVVIKNRSNQPMNELSFDEIWPGKITPAVTVSDLKKNPAGISSGIDPASLFSLRRVLPKKISFSDFDADKETIGYSFDFIMPGDSVAVIIPFYPVPASVRKFSVRLSYNSAGIKKSVAFELRRVEYRQDMPYKK